MNRLIRKEKTKNENRIHRSFFRMVHSSHRHLADHSSHCTVALNMFLQCQPKYWCFVPMTCTNADLDDVKFEQSYHENPCTTSVISPYERSVDLIHWCIEHLPTPPYHYRFSKRQRIQQHEFFLNRYEKFPTRFLDMYNATIVVACKFLRSISHVFSFSCN